MTTYGYEITWTQFYSHGRLHVKRSIQVRGLPSPEAAYQEALRQAKLHGWTPRRWWKWWRWSDAQRPSETDAI